MERGSQGGERGSVRKRRCTWSPGRGRVGVLEPPARPCLRRWIAGCRWPAAALPLPTAQPSRLRRLGFAFACSVGRCCSVLLDSLDTSDGTSERSLDLDRATCVGLMGWPVLGQTNTKKNVAISIGIHGNTGPYPWRRRCLVGLDIGEVTTNDSQSKGTSAPSERIIHLHKTPKCQSWDLTPIGLDYNSPPNYQSKGWFSVVCYSIYSLYAFETWPK
jgi:hypothetical protein